jgi:hypothetical protein
VLPVLRVLTEYFGPHRTNITVTCSEQSNLRNVLQISSFHEMKASKFYVLTARYHLLDFYVVFSKLEANSEPTECIPNLPLPHILVSSVNNIGFLTNGANKRMKTMKKNKVLNQGTQDMTTC